MEASDATDLGVLPPQTDSKDSRGEKGDTE
jgi:hypothetical protein